MEPITHALGSLALARAGLDRVTPRAAPMLLISGLAADLDWLARSAGAEAFLRVHRTPTHCLVGTAGIALIVAGAFWALGRRTSNPLRFARALGVCAAGAGFHLLLDLTNSYGVKLLWPLKGKWFAWDLLGEIDPWVLFLLLLGLLLPELFRLISEEIGARPRQRGAQRGAIIALALLLGYGVGRWALHDQAMELLRSHLYRGETPLHFGAFPAGASPLDWHGVVETENTLVQVQIPLAAGAVFDSDAARVQFKPAASPALEAARKSRVATVFLDFARFPKATVEKSPEGYRVELRDLRFASSRAARSGFSAVIELNGRFQVVHEQLQFGSSERR